MGIATNLQARARESIEAYVKLLSLLTQHTCDELEQLESSQVRASSALRTSASEARTLCLKGFVVGITGGLLGGALIATSLVVALRDATATWWPMALAGLVVAGFTTYLALAVSALKPLPLELREQLLAVADSAGRSDIRDQICRLLARQDGKLYCDQLDAVQRQLKSDIDAMRELAFGGGSRH